jgi:hypothetical protein
MRVIDLPHAWHDAASPAGGSPVRAVLPDRCAATRAC